MSLTAKEALNTLLAHRDLSREDMLAVMRQIMTGEYTPVQIAGVLIALRSKGETVEEIGAAASVMRELSTKVNLGNPATLVDTCGTGGDGAHTFNISTASAFVAAAAGVQIAKHGGRSVSSTSGSADVLEQLGVNVNLSPEQVAECVNTLGVGFMFAPNHHSAMRFAAPVRRELGVRTLFNLLGPLTNPAGAQNQVLGVFSADWVRPLAEVLRDLGSRHVLIVHAEEGLDEISLAGRTHIAELQNGTVREYTVEAADFGLTPAPTESLAVHNVDEACSLLRAALQNSHRAAADIVALNAGAALYVGGKAATLHDSVALARQVISSGAALAKLQALIDFTQRYKA